MSGNMPITIKARDTKRTRAQTPSINPSVYFADKYKQVNIKVHLQGEWKKRGDSLLGPLTHTTHTTFSRQLVVL